MLVFLFDFFGLCFVRGLLTSGGFVCFTFCGFACVWFLLFMVGWLLLLFCWLLLLFGGCDWLLYCCDVPVNTLVGALRLCCIVCLLGCFVVCFDLRFILVLRVVGSAIVVC